MRDARRWQKESVAIALLVACGAPTQTAPISNQPTTTKAFEPAPAAPDVTSCRALVTKEYDDGHDEYVDPSGKKIVVTTTDVCGLVMEPIFFKRNSAQVMPQSADPVASMLACLAQTEGTKFAFELTGHATPDEPNPDGLALARAQAVEQYFTACGVPVLRMTSLSEGVRKPNVRDDPERQRAASRRVELLITERSPER